MSQSGKAVIVRFRDDATTPAFQTIGGLRSRSISFNAETVDVTNAGSTDNWRELLDGVGVRSATISGEGVFKDDAGFEALRDAYAENEVRQMEFVVPNLGAGAATGTISGSFIVTALSVSAEYNREVTFSATFESAGVVSFA